MAMAVFNMYLFRSFVTFVLCCEINFADVCLFHDCFIPLPFSDCGILPAVTNGTVDQSGGTLYQDTTLFTCDLGFNLQGTSVRTCGPDGTWDSAQPTCDIAGKDVAFAVGYIKNHITRSFVILILRF